MPAATPPYHGGHLMPTLEDAAVADAMHPGILACEVDATLTDVARIMATHRIHCVAVTQAAHDESGEPYVRGLISDLDLMRAALDPGEQRSAAALGQQTTISIPGNMPLREAAALMLSHEVTHLVVIHPASLRPIGVLSTLDIALILAWGERD